MTSRIEKIPACGLAVHGILIRAGLAKSMARAQQLTREGRVTVDDRPTGNVCEMLRAGQRLACDGVEVQLQAEGSR